jgi:hypothetical protein
MLTTLTGAAPSSLVGHVLGEPDPAVDAAEEAPASDETAQVSEQSEEDAGPTFAEVDAHDDGSGGHSGAEPGTETDEAALQENRDGEDNWDQKDHENAEESPSSRGH